MARVALPFMWTLLDLIDPDNELIKNLVTVKSEIAGPGF